MEYLINLIFIICGLSFVSMILSRSFQSQIDEQNNLIKELKRKIDHLEAELLRTFSGRKESSYKEEPASNISEEVTPTESASVVSPDKTSTTHSPAGKHHPTLTFLTRTQPEKVVNESVRTVSDQEWWTKFEENIGKRWMTWVGVVVLFLSIGFFVKYSIDNQWVKPTVRITSSMIFGTILLGTGAVFVKRRMTAIGQGLMGGGLAILYVSLFAGFGFYKLIPPTIAFTGMVAVTISGMGLAIGFDAIAISFLATLGGFLTPIMVSTGQDARDILFSYILLLDVGVLGVAFFKRWRALDILAFVGTSLMFFGWFSHYYTAAAMIPALLWLAGFFLTFFITAFIYHIRYSLPIPLERFTLTIANAVQFFIYGYYLLHQAHPVTLGYITLGMATCYLLMGVFFRRRIPEDTRAIFSFISLSIAFFTITIPLWLGLNGITLAWAVEGPALLYLGYRYTYSPVRKGAFLILAITVIRLFLFHWPIFDRTEMLLINRSFGLALFVLLAMACFSTIHHRWRKLATVTDRALKILTGIGAGFLALLFLAAELGPWLSINAGVWSMDAHYLEWSGMLLLWSLGVPAFAIGGVWTQCRWARMAGLLPAAIAVTFALRLYGIDYEIPHTLFLNLRFAAAFIAVLSIFAYAFILRRYPLLCTKEEQTISTFVYTVTGFGLLLLLTTEVYHYGARPDNLYFTFCSLLALWSIGSMGFLASGVWNNRITYRIIGVLPLIIALSLAIKLYLLDNLNEYHLGINLRFGTELLSIFVAFVYARTLFHRSDAPASPEKKLGQYLYGICLFLFLLLLSTEPAVYWHHSVENAQKARWLIQMSLTIVWSLYATGALLVGFWRKIRILRFAALGLFGVTAIKLVLVDMADIKQIYRIVSFLVLGLLMIGASYLYHKLEKYIDRKDG